MGDRNGVELLAGVMITIAFSERQNAAGDPWLECNRYYKTSVVKARTSHGGDNALNGLPGAKAT
jgi:hypothetical protein